MRRIDYLREQAEQLGLTPYAGLYGDKRKLATWQKLLESENLEPLPPRQIETSKQINWPLAIALFVGAMTLLCLIKPIADKAFPVRINIQIGGK
jgi:hypothetical protein